MTTKKRKPTKDEPKVKAGGGAKVAPTVAIHTRRIPGSDRFEAKVVRDDRSTGIVNDLELEELGALVVDAYAR